MRSVKEFGGLRLRSVNPARARPERSAPDQQRQRMTVHRQLLLQPPLLLNLRLPPRQLLPLLGQQSQLNQQPHKSRQHVVLHQLGARSFVLLVFRKLLVTILTIRIINAAAILFIIRVDKILRK